MDWLRSCYSTSMVFREGDSAQPVRWYFCDTGAKAFPGFHAFGSKNWVSRQAVAGDLGEQPGPRPWVNGAKPANGGVGNINAVLCALLHPDWWQEGIPEGEESGPYEPDGKPTCCVAGPPPPPDPCTSTWSCGNLPDVLTCRVDSATGTFFCGDPTGTEFNLVRSMSDPCLWVGSPITGGLFGNVFFAAGDPSGGITEECPDLPGKAFSLEFQYIGLVRDGPLSCDCVGEEWTFTLTMAGVSNLCLLDGTVLNLTVFAP